MYSDNSDLIIKRINASEASKGISSDSVYKVVIEFLKDVSLIGDLLEFGSGTGNLLVRISDIGYSGKITATDIKSRPKDLHDNVEWIQGDLNNPIDVPDNSFDVIISTEVIEHLENPRAIFREFYRILRPGGILLVTTPNQESIRSYAALLFGGHFVGFLDNCYPAHITALLRKDFERICEEVNFSTPKFSYTDSGSIPKFPHILWQEASFNLLKGRFFSDNLIVATSKMEKKI